MAYCTQQEWCNANCKYQSYYLQEYPWLEMFPPNYNDLVDFYVWDMTSRNLTPLQSYINCYEFVLSYALENMPRVGKEGRFTGQTFFQRLINDQWRNESILWTSLKQTKDQITTGIKWLFPVAIVFLVFYVLKD